MGAGWASGRESPDGGHSACGYFFLAGQLAAGTCEIVTLDRDSSQPRRTIARQTARCACRKGQIAGTTRARPACVDGKSSRPSGDTSGYRAQSWRASVPTSITLKEISSECSEAKTSRCIPRVRPLGNLSLIWLFTIFSLIWYPWAACPVHMGVATDYMVPGIKNLKSPTRYGSCSQPTKMFVITSWAASV